MSYPRYTLHPAEPTDPAFWRTYSTMSRTMRDPAGHVVRALRPGALKAAQARAMRTGRSVVVRKNGRLYRVLNPDGGSHRLDLGPGRGALHPGKINNLRGINPLDLQE